MLKEKFAIMTIILLAIIGEMNAQRHYKRISALEFTYGTTMFSETDNYANISFSRYINRKAYWKVGINYLENTHSYSPSEPAAISLSNIPNIQTMNISESEIARNWYADGMYNYTFLSNLKSLYWNIGAGMFIGTEYTKHPDSSYQFIIGPEIGTEIELFILPRLAFNVGIKEMWSPLAVKEWNTIWNAGIKVLLYK